MFSSCHDLQDHAQSEQVPSSQPLHGSQQSLMYGSQQSLMYGSQFASQSQPSLGHKSQSIVVPVLETLKGAPCACAT
jgi:hypothetical protein